MTRAEATPARLCVGGSGSSALRAVAEPRRLRLAQGQTAGLRAATAWPPPCLLPRSCSCAQYTDDIVLPRVPPSRTRSHSGASRPSAPVFILGRYYCSFNSIRDASWQEQRCPSCAPGTDTGVAHVAHPSPGGVTCSRSSPCGPCCSLSLRRVHGIPPAGLSVCPSGDRRALSGLAAVLSVPLAPLAVLWPLRVSPRLFLPRLSACPNPAFGRRSGALPPPLPPRRVRLE